MTARPIRRNAQTPDRNGKIFYTSTTSLSHISKISGYETAYGRHWISCCWSYHRPCTRQYDVTGYDRLIILMIINLYPHPHLEMSKKEGDYLDC